MFSARSISGLHVPLQILWIFALALPIHASEQSLRFNRDIRPILSDNCFGCHGPDKGKRAAGLRLDTREAALAGVDKRPAIVPGKSDASEVYKRLVTEDLEKRMPHKDLNKTLTKEQIALIKRWINEGATYESHWAYIPPEKKTPEQSGNPIDGFIRSELSKKGLKPGPEADRSTLIRRLSLDLIGLPPSRSEIEAFVNDTSAEAYGKLVDRLLASPHYGERMAVPWLDAVRFADTVGFHGDQNQRIFPYRDYVIDAFNKNKPFDQFTIEQIAGDLLPNPTEEQLVATGFNRLNMMSREGGAQPKEYIAKYQADRVRTVSTAWLGSTMACAECHDHKFDPFTTKDFYQMEAFFADVKQWGVYSSYPYSPEPELAGFSDYHPFPPELEVESRFLSERRKRLLNEQELLLSELKPEPDAFAKWKAEMGLFLTQNPEGWLEPVPRSVGKIQIPMKARSIAGLEIELPLRAGSLTALRLIVPPLTQQQTVVLSAKLNGKPLRFRKSDAAEKGPVYFEGEDMLDLQKGWKVPVSKTPLSSVWILNGPIQTREGDLLEVTLSGIQSEGTKVAVSPLAGPKMAELSLENYLASTAWDKDAFQRYTQLEQEILNCRNGRAKTLVTKAIEQPRLTRVLARGNWQDESGEIVEPAVPHFLPQPAAAGKRRLNRLDLANWLVSPENPLTGRAVMNRLWKQFFGNGISAFVEDIGSQGEWPSHPELIDWLAVEFRESRWDLKHMVRLMVTSETYKQTSKFGAEQLERDPANRFLATQSPRRLEAEFVRDNALAVAGLLDLALGGPSVKPYQPDGYYANLQFPTRLYVSETNEQQYRRGLYIHWQRTFLHPMLANFDAPSREETACSRTVANTPQQALTLLNDPTFVEASRVLAGKLLASGGSDQERLTELFERALARPPKQKEIDSLMLFLQGQRNDYQAAPEEAVKLVSIGLAEKHLNNPVEQAAWTQVCRVVLNLHETITRF